MEPFVKNKLIELDNIIIYQKKIYKKFIIIHNILTFLSICCSLTIPILESFEPFSIKNLCVSVLGAVTPFAITVDTKFNIHNKKEKYRKNIITLKKIKTESQKKIKNPDEFENLFNLLDNFII